MEATKPIDESTLSFKISAPSKALITGGYLVIDPSNSGVVIALDQYFHCHVQIQ